MIYSSDTWRAKKPEDYWAINRHRPEKLSLLTLNAQTEFSLIIKWYISSQFSRFRFSRFSLSAYERCVSDWASNSPPRISQQAALATHVHLEGVAGDHEALQQQHTRSVADQTVPLHLTQTQTSVSGATLCWLPVGTTDTFRQVIQSSNAPATYSIYTSNLITYLVRTALGPRALACILSRTMCFSFW